MSAQARAALVSKLIFQDETQKSDLLDESKTQTSLIAYLLGLVDKGYHIEITAVRTDHDDDSALGLHCHANGYAVDCWPLNSATPGDYMTQDTHPFRQFLVDAASSPWNFQIGLGGCADNSGDAIAAGSTEFPDNGADHIHLGSSGS